MSDSKDLYWKTLNQMLRNDETEFNPSKNELPAQQKVIWLIIKDEEFKKGVQFALNNVNEIAKLEYMLNDGQPAKTTLKHLQWAKVYIESNKCCTKRSYSALINAQNFVSVGEFLLDCYAAIQQDIPEFHIRIDTKREELMKYLFGNEFVKDEYDPKPEQFKAVDISCTQIIFESGDVASAIDELIMNVSDRTLSPWRIISVYIQESLKNTVHEMLKSDRLNAANNITCQSLVKENRQKCEELAKRFGGKFIGSSNGSILLMLDVPLKYLPQSTETTFNQIPVAINFFRTTKEVIQLAKGDFQPGTKHLTSIWTENIELYYELAAELNAEIIWSNSIGVFDEIIPSLNNKLESEQIIRFELF